MDLKQECIDRVDRKYPALHMNITKVVHKINACGEKIMNDQELREGQILDMYNDADKWSKVLNWLTHIKQGLINKEQAEMDKAGLVLQN